MTSYNETLAATDTSDSVWFGRAELGYQFGENWDLSFAYTHFAEAEVQIAFPKYPNIVSIVPLPDYKRHVMKYRIKRLSLMPTYKVEAGDRMRFGVGVGLTCSWTSSHIEATYRQWSVGMDNSLVSQSSPAEKDTSWSGLVALSADYALLKRTSLSLALAYAPTTIKVASARGNPSQGPSKASRSTVRVDTLEAALTVSSRW